MNGALSLGEKLTLKLTCQRGVSLGQPTSRRAGMEKSQGQMGDGGRMGGGGGRGGRMGGGGGPKGQADSTWPQGTGNFKGDNTCFMTSNNAWLLMASHNSWLIARLDKGQFASCVTPASPRAFVCSKCVFVTQSLFLILARLFLCCVKKGVYIAASHYSAGHCHYTPEVSMPPGLLY